MARGTELTEHPLPALHRGFLLRKVAVGTLSAQDTARAPCPQDGVHLPDPLGYPNENRGVALCDSHLQDTVEGGRQYPMV